jgi:Leucine-rich repeat (LRR) protein
VAPPDDLGLLGRQLLRLNANANKLEGMPANTLMRLGPISGSQAELHAILSSRCSATDRFVVLAVRSASQCCAVRPSMRAMPSLRALKDLVFLGMSENALTILPELPTSNKLAQVFFGFNALTDVSALVSCPGLVTVDLHNNRIESLPRGLERRDSNIKLIDVSNNELVHLLIELG